MNCLNLYCLHKLGQFTLDDISFSVKKGEIMGFLGPNGAGKSTTMNIICGCISPGSGSVTVDGYDVLENPMEVKKRIGYLPENPPLYYDMTVKEYLNFVYELKKVNLSKEEHLQDVMDLVQIYDKKDRLIKNLSKGYKQRVGLAQALIGDPEVLILDEPTVGLDPRQIMEIREVIKSLGKNKTIILSTHIMQEIEAVCDSVTIIAQGNIVAENTLAEIGEEAGGKNRYILGVLGNGEVAYNTIKSMPETVSCEVSRIEKICRNLLLNKLPTQIFACHLQASLQKTILRLHHFAGQSFLLKKYL